MLKVEIGTINAELPTIKYIVDNYPFKFYVGNCGSKLVEIKKDKDDITVVKQSSFGIFSYDKELLDWKALPDGDFLIDSENRKIVYNLTEKKWALRENVSSFPFQKDAGQLNFVATGMNNKLTKFSIAVGLATVAFTLPYINNSLSIPDKDLNEDTLLQVINYIANYFRIKEWVPYTGEVADLARYLKKSHSSIQRFFVFPSRLSALKRKEGIKVPKDNRKRKNSDDPDSVFYTLDFLENLTGEALDYLEEGGIFVPPECGMDKFIDKMAVEDAKIKVYGKTYPLPESLYNYFSTAFGNKVIFVMEDGNQFYYEEGGKNAS